MVKYLVFTVLVLLVGCSSSDDSQGSFDIDSFPQTWVLEEMSLGLSGETVTDNDLPYQETIVLKDNGDFEKTRKSSDSMSMGKGTFLFNKSTINTVLVLNYDSETDLISSCSREKIVEKLIVTSSNSLSGGSAPCDGPGLFFTRIE